MSGTLQIVGPDSITRMDGPVAGSVDRWMASSSGSGAHCFGNVWPLEKRVGAEVQEVQVQVVRVRQVVAGTGCSSPGRWAAGQVGW